jgi:putative flippase GtrA
MFRYLSSGLACAVIEYSVLVMLFGGLGWNVHVSNFTALTVACTCNYLLSRYWVFGQSDRQMHFEFMLFAGVTIVSFALNHLLFLALYKLQGWDYRIAKVATICVVTAFNYMAKRLFVFRKVA